ncbi:MAG: hypothetical protein ACO3BH_02305 [Quisquiliibacterium sp.]|jgi:hypothetical protein
MVNGLVVISAGKRLLVLAISRWPDGADIDPAALARTRVLGPQGATQPADLPVLD